jgi:hypothetical protein
LEYGDKINPILDKCSVAVGDWRFLDLTGSSRDPSCPWYGYYLAVYLRPCTDTPCSNKANNYGLIEISEKTANMSLTKFQEMVLSSNPFPFLPVGVQNYTRITGESTPSHMMNPKSFSSL